MVVVVWAAGVFLIVAISFTGMGILLKIVKDSEWQDFMILAITAWLGSIGMSVFALAFLR